MPSDWDGSSRWQSTEGMGVYTRRPNGRAPAQLGAPSAARPNLEVAAESRVLLLVERRNAFFRRCARSRHGPACQADVARTKNSGASGPVTWVNGGIEHAYSQAELIIAAPGRMAS